ncbi:MAG TPA: class I SAM-dependent methyltransferase [Candidatus Goldiibacteriota bacterium]|nr:class I SAM-dependent methyltransferase [Candidatus Goldiibacteriota bacterium]
MKKYPLRSCPICGNGKESEILHTQAFKLPEGHVLSGYDKYDVVACDECGFVYADTKAGQQLYDRYYRDMSKYESDYTTVDINRYMDQAELIYSLAGKNALKVADIGCGNGGLLQALRLKGFNDVCGIDPSAKCIEYIKSNGIKAYQAGFSV